MEELDDGQKWGTVPGSPGIATVGTTPEGDITEATKNLALLTGTGTHSQTRYRALARDVIRLRTCGKKKVPYSGYNWREMNLAN